MLSCTTESNHSVDIIKKNNIDSEDSDNEKSDAPKADQQPRSNEIITSNNSKSGSSENTSHQDQTSGKCSENDESTLIGPDFTGHDENTLEQSRDVNKLNEVSYIIRTDTKENESSCEFQGHDTKWFVNGTTNETTNEADSINLPDSAFKTIETGADLKEHVNDDGNQVNKDC